MSETKDKPAEWTEIRPGVYSRPVSERVLKKITERLERRRAYEEIERRQRIPRWIRNLLRRTETEG